MDKKTWKWKRTINAQDYLLSSDPSLLPHSFVHEAFATEDMFWAEPMSDEEMGTMLSNSLTLGLYRLSSNGIEKEAVGMARIITDYSTLFYLTDVFLQPPYRDLGLGKFMVRSCREMVLGFPNLRFMMLLTGTVQAQQLYRKELGMSLLDGQEQSLTCMGARRTALADAAAAEASKPAA